VTTQSLLPSFEPQPLQSVDRVSDGVYQSLSESLKAFKTLMNPQTCDAKYLPYLAYAFGVDFWDDSLIEAQKRELIQKSLLLHKKKGTVWAIEEVFKAIKVNARISEWFEYGGDPYKFKIDIDVQNDPITDETIRKLSQYIDTYKNVRSTLESIQINLTNYGDIVGATALQSGEKATVYPYTPREIDISGTSFAVAAFQSVETATVYPQVQR
jgi:phage tail P2-like protein